MGCPHRKEGLCLDSATADLKATHEYKPKIEMDQSPPKPIKHAENWKSMDIDTQYVFYSSAIVNVQPTHSQNSF